MPVIYATLAYAVKTIEKSIYCALTINEFLQKDLGGTIQVAVCFPHPLNDLETILISISKMRTSEAYSY